MCMFDLALDLCNLLLALVNSFDLPNRQAPMASIDDCEPHLTVFSLALEILTA